MVQVSRRTALVSTAAASAALSLAACGERPGSTGASDGGGSAPTKGALNLWHPYTQPERQAALQKVFDAYTAETGVEVKAEVVAFGDFPKRWPSAQASNTLPDIAITTPEVAMSMWTAGAVESMDDIISDAGGEGLYVDGLLDRTSRYDGKLFCLPHYVHTRLMHVRTDRLAEAGLSMPSTMPEFLTAAEAMTKAPDYYGFIPQLSQNDVGGSYLLWIMAQANGASLFTKDGKVTLTDPGVVDAANWLGTITKNAAPASAATTPISETFNLINSGSASMATTSAAGIASALAEAPEVAANLDAVPMPSGSAGVGNLIGAVSVVKPKTKNTVDAGAFMKLLLKKDLYTEFLLCLPLFHFPATKDGSGSEFYANETITRYKGAVDATIEGIAEGAAPGFEDGANPYSGSFFSAGRIEKALQDVAFNGISAADAMKSAQDDLQTTLDGITERL